MLSYISRSSQLAPALKSTVQVVANGTKNIVPGVYEGTKGDIVQPSPVTLTGLAKHTPTGLLRAKSGITVSSQVRHAHSDVEVPDFSYYRRKDVQDPRVNSKESGASRRSFTYVVAGGGVVTGLYTAKSVVTKFVSSMSASADVLAMAKIEVKTNDIPEGKSVTFKWRGKPLFVKHRTDEEISIENSVDVGSLRHPEADTERCQDPKWLIVIGVCTHLGCVPIADAGEFGGYYCPCHGSHYDASGRIRKGPAPLNLEVPNYSFPEEGVILVG